MLHALPLHLHQAGEAGKLLWCERGPRDLPRWPAALHGGRQLHVPLQWGCWLGRAHRPLLHHHMLLVGRRRWVEKITF